MTDPVDQTAPAGSPEGHSVRPRTREELIELIELAFDYRGDVTIELTAGRKFEGYVSNRDTRAARPYLDIIPQEGPETVQIPYDEIVAVTFSGEDTAFGKSWHEWMSKHESQRRAEAEKVEQEARARGLL